MECPKCGGGGFLSEEELIKILEDSRRSEVRAVLRATYQCRACAEKFSRLFVEELSKRKKPLETAPSNLNAASTGTQSSSETQSQRTSSTDDVPAIQWF